MNDNITQTSFLAHGIDHAAALDRFNANRKLYVYSLRQYFDKHLHFVRDFLDSYTAANYRHAKVFIHNLSSQSAMLGLYKIHYYSDLIERQMDLQAKELPSLMQNLVIIEGCIHEAKAVIEQLICELVVDEKRKIEDISPQSLVLKLTLALREADPNALRIFREHEREYQIILGEIFNDVSQLVQNFEFQSAREIIDKWGIANQITVC